MTDDIDVQSTISLAEKLRAVTKLVRNVLLRDNTPSRTEISDELVMVVSEVLSHLETKKEAVGFVFDETEKALGVARKWMLDNPDVTPKFDNCFGTIVNSDNGTKEMTSEIVNIGKIDVSSPAFDFNSYAIGVLEYKKQLDMCQEVEDVYNVDFG